MFGELKSLLDRNFIIGFFVPASICLFSVIFLLDRYGIKPPDAMKFDPHAKLEDLTYLALVAWGGALLLLAFNRELIRALEGYWPLIQSKCSKHNKESFRTLLAKINQSTKGSDDRAKLMLEFAGRYPSSEDQVLPTSFGNTLRAFEDYSRAMYRVESIQGWTRLRAVMSKEYCDAMDGAESFVNFWVNLFWVGLIDFGVSAVLAVRDMWWYSSWHGVYWSAHFVINPLKWALIPIASLAIVAICYIRARSAAEGWGEWVKGAFDVYLPDLCKKLGYERPATISEERALWLRFSQGMVYRLPEKLDKLNPFRTKPPTGSDDDDDAKPKANGQTGDADDPADRLTTSVIVVLEE